MPGGAGSSGAHLADVADLDRLQRRRIERGRIHRHDRPSEDVLLVPGLPREDDRTRVSAHREDDRERALHERLTGPRILLTEVPTDGRCRRCRVTDRKAERVVAPREPRRHIGNRRQWCLPPCRPPSLKDLAILARSYGDVQGKTTFALVL